MCDCAHHVLQCHLLSDKFDSYALHLECICHKWKEKFALQQEEMDFVTEATASAMISTSPTGIYRSGSIGNKHLDDLLNKDFEMSGAMELLKLGVQKQKHDAAEKAKAKEKAKAEVKIEDLVLLCSNMNETQAISERIYSRLVDVEKEISTLSELVRQEATPRFKQLVEKTHGFMIKHANKHTVTRVVGSQVMIDTSRDLNRELDALLLQFDVPGAESGVHDWKKQWDIDSAAMKLSLKESLKKKDVLMSELQDPVAQAEALTLLMFECNNNASQFSDEEMALINELFQYVSSMSRLEIPAVPQWFVPPHEVQFNPKTSFAGGSYGSVHHGTWNGTAVVVKSAFLEDEKSRQMFLNETKIWFKLQHPHIVTLFRACHIGNPFFVCDLASNGTLSQYLYRDIHELQEIAYCPCGASATARTIGCFSRQCSCTSAFTVPPRLFLAVLALESSVQNRVKVGHQPGYGARVALSNLA